MSSRYQMVICQRCGRGFVLTPAYRDFLARRGVRVAVPLPLFLNDLQLVLFLVDHGGEPAYGALLISRERKAVYTSDTSNHLPDEVLALVQDADSQILRRLPIHRPHR